MLVCSVIFYLLGNFFCSAIILRFPRSRICQMVHSFLDLRLIAWYPLVFPHILGLSSFTSFPLFLFSFQLHCCPSSTTGHSTSDFLPIHRPTRTLVISAQRRPTSPARLRLLANCSHQPTARHPDLRCFSPCPAHVPANKQHHNLVGTQVFGLPGARLAASTALCLAHPPPRSPFASLALRPSLARSPHLSRSTLLERPPSQSSCGPNSVSLAEPPPRSPSASLALRLAHPRPRPPSTAASPALCRSPSASPALCLARPPPRSPSASLALRPARPPPRPPSASPALRPARPPPRPPSASPALRIARPPPLALCLNRPRPRLPSASPPSASPALRRSPSASPARYLARPPPRSPCTSLAPRLAHSLLCSPLVPLNLGPTHPASLCLDRPSPCSAIALDSLALRLARPQARLTCLRSL